MGLKEIYESWNFRPVMNGANKTPRDQKDGKIAVDFLPNTYQTEVRNRAPGDVVVSQATEDDATKGSFNQQALKYYSTLIASPLKTFKSKVVHKYNAQGTSDVAKYTTTSEIKDTPGALYNTNS